MFALRSYQKAILVIAAIIVIAILMGLLEISKPSEMPKTPETQKQSTSNISQNEISLSWEPIRIVNDKIYDIRVEIKVKNADQLKWLKLKLIPVEYSYFISSYGMRQENYSAVFPSESIRSVDLQPGNISVNFTNLAGGREYIISAEGEDSAGRILRKEVKTPYIRQYENIAPLDDILIGAFYYPWYNEDDPWFHFWFNEKEWESLGYRLSPLLGHYASNDPILISKHIDWATGHGIDYFLISWGYAGGPGGFNDMVLKEILRNQLIGQIKFAILYESGGRLKKNEKGEFNLSDSTNREQLINDFNYLAENYFSHPSYLEVKGGKVVFFDASRFFIGDVQSALKQLREAAKTHQLYLICDALGNFLPPTDQKMMELLRSFDAVSADDMWVNNYGDPDARRDFVSYTDKALGLWKSHTDEYNHDLIPSINPGWEPYLYFKLFPNFNAPFLERSAERYGKLVSIALKYGNHVIVGHFNEFFAHNHIEPDTKDGFAYLEVLRNILMRKN